MKSTKSNKGDLTPLKSGAKDKDYVNYDIGYARIDPHQMGNYLAGYAFAETGAIGFLAGVHGVGSFYGVKNSVQNGAGVGWVLGDDWGSFVMLYNGEIDGISDSLFSQEDP